MFGGRLVETGRLTNSLYALDLTTYVWTLIEIIGKSSLDPRHQQPAQGSPRPRYFHTACNVDKLLILFGGMMEMFDVLPGGQTSTRPRFSVLADTAIYNTVTREWTIPDVVPDEMLPIPRYAHIAVAHGQQMLVLGGQDLTNNYVQEYNVFDVQTLKWTQKGLLTKQYGAYRSLALVSSSSFPQYPSDDQDEETGILETAEKIYHQITSTEPRTPQQTDSPSSKGRLRSGSASAVISTPPKRQPLNFSELKLSPSPASNRQISNNNNNNNNTTTGRANPTLLSTTRQEPRRPQMPVYMYTNYNFSDVVREFQLLRPPFEKTLNLEDFSTKLHGTYMPPGLRFPSGGIIGNTVLISGIYITSETQIFSMWSLNLVTLEWQRVDSGNVLQQGSWNRGVVSPRQNAFLIFGAEHRSLVDDYRHRRLNFQDLLVVDLEAFGVYATPECSISSFARQLGAKLLRDSSTADMDILTKDLALIACSSRVLSIRWPYFMELLMHGLHESSQQHQARKQSVATTVSSFTSQNMGSFGLRSSDGGIGISSSIRAIDRPRVLHLPYSYIICSAFLYFLYTDTLPRDSLSEAPTLAALLLISCDYPGLERLNALATHGLHQVLDISSATLIYETAALTGKSGLQIRALKVMITAKRVLQQQNHTPGSTIDLLKNSGSSATPSLKASP